MSPVIPASGLWRSLFVFLLKTIRGAMAFSMSIISTCDVTECSYNRDNTCHTPAITVGDGGCPMCDTYAVMSQKGGSSEVSGGVGACRSFDCKYNTSLECAAGTVHIGKHEGHADCMTYVRR